MGHEIMGQRPLLLRAGEEHVDRVADRGVDIDDERFLFSAEEKCRAIGGRDDGLELDGDNLLLRHKK